MIPYAIMVVRNEEPRYLDAMLYWHSRRIPYFFIVDDGSTDDTFNVCSLYTEHVVRRPKGVPSFLEDEGALRAWAWKEAGRNLELTDGDWLLALDADEFYVPLEGLESVCEDAESIGASAVRFRMPEVWDHEASDGGIYPLDQGDGLMIRTDGFWCKTRNTRLVKFRRDAIFPVGRMGGGSVPLQHGKLLDSKDHILHFGYLDRQDRLDKYERYKSNNNIHSRAHIDSIPMRPRLKAWEGEVPTWWRGLSESSLQLLDQANGVSEESN